MTYHLTLGNHGGLNHLVATSASGHRIGILFESSRWMEAILSVVGNAAARFISWAEAAELNRVLRMFFGEEVKTIQTKEGVRWGR